MLIEFSVSNFRSFRERQTLSMVAASRLRKRENTFVPDAKGERLPALLKACVIYGPNASGKSNLLRALQVVQLIARRQPSNEARRLPVTPFMFDPVLVNKPSQFEIHFVHRSCRYQFEVSATADRIVHERLICYPSGKETPLYDRQFKDGQEVYEFGEALEGGRDLHDTWAKLTAPNLLYLSQAVANSAENLTQLRPPHEWITDAVFTVLNGMQMLSRVSQELVGSDASHGEDIAEFLKDVDVPISRIRVEPREDEISSAANTGNAPLGESPTSMPLKNQRPRTWLTHRTALGEAELRFEDESEGTKNLMGFWLPWATRDIGVNSEKHARCVLVVDELDSSLHPKIVVALVAKHISAKRPSQLIFTTHDTHLMDAKLLRRDQIWITERDANGATQVRSIHDFEGRESEDVEKRYYEGRYRGLPLLRSE